MILPDWQIRHLCTDSESPLVTPFDANLINPASLDIRVGYTLKVERPIYEKTFFGKRLMHTYLDDLLDFREHTLTNPYIIEPGQFILTSTLEDFIMPNDLAGQIQLKSTSARKGWGHAMSGWIDPGFNGVLTLELKNYLQLGTLEIYPGMRIAQIKFYKMENPPDSNYREGKYSGKSTVCGAIE